MPTPSDKYAAYLDGKQPASGDPYADYLDSTPPKASGIGEGLKDLGRSLKSGIEQLPGIATGLADIAPALAFNARPFTKAADSIGELS